MTTETPNTATATSPELAIGPPPPRPSRAVIAAICVAALCAGSWATLEYSTGNQFAWLGWGIGAAVGWVAAIAGGRGGAVATLCALLALASIVSGRLISESPLRGQHIARAMPKSRYDELQRDATAFAEVADPTSRKQIRMYMFENGFCDCAEPSLITSEQVDAFQLEHLPELAKFAAGQPSLAEWQDEATSVFAAVYADLDAASLLFLLLGVVTAFGLVQRYTISDARVARGAEMAARRSRRVAD